MKINVVIDVDFFKDIQIILFTTTWNVKITYRSTQNK